MRLDERWNDAEQLQPLVRRVEVDQRDDEDDRRTRPPTILREQQRSTGRTCVEVAGRTLIPASGALPPETAQKQPGEPPKIDLQGVDGVNEARARTPPNPLSTPPLLRCGGRAAERCYRRA
eukprot:COSAG02_NODE_1928_length_10338_cov_85.895888_4_plen_121_part_00